MWLLAVSGGDWWGMLDRARRPRARSHRGGDGALVASRRLAGRRIGAAAHARPRRRGGVAGPTQTAALAPRPGHLRHRARRGRGRHLIAQGSSTGIKVSFGLAVVVCAVGLLVGTLLGRARWLVVPAALFAAVSVAGAATENLDVSITGTRQDTYVGPGRRRAATVEHRQGRWRHRPAARGHHRARGRRHPGRLRRRCTSPPPRMCAWRSAPRSASVQHRHAERLGGRLPARRDLRRWTVECAARPLRHRGRLRQHRDQPLRPFAAPARRAEGAGSRASRRPGPRWAGRCAVPVGRLATGPTGRSSCPTARDPCLLVCASSIRLRRCCRAARWWSLTAPASCRREGSSCLTESSVEPVAPNLPEVPATAPPVPTTEVQP